MLRQRSRRAASRARCRTSISRSADVAPDSRACSRRTSALQRVQMVEVYRVGAGRRLVAGLEPVLDVAAPALPPGYSRGAGRPAGGAGADRRAPRRARSRRSGAAGDLLHAAAVIRDADGRATGVVVATDYLTGDWRDRASRRMTQAFESYNQLRVLQAAADRRLPVVLPDGDAADPRRRDLDGLVPGEAHHAARCRCWRRPPARSARAGSISASSRRATTSSAR